MRRIKWLFASIFPHVCIVIAGMLIVFFVFDRFNDAMGFFDNLAAKILIFCLAAFSIVQSSCWIARLRREKRRMLETEKKEKRHMCEKENLF